MEDSKRRHIFGVLKIPMIICWIFFGLHFVYILFYHGIWEKYIDIYDVIIDTYLLFSLEAIAVLLTLSNFRNNFLFFLLSFYISIANVIFILFYIFIIVFSFFIDDKLEDFIDAEDWVKDDWWKGLVLLIIKVVEALPLCIIYIFKRMLAGPLGAIMNPQAISPGGILDKNEKDEEDNELE